MSKKLWIGIAAVLVIDMSVAGVLLLPGLLDDESHSQNDPPVDIDTGREVVIPGHWWKTYMTDEQLQLLGEVWDTELTCMDLLQLLWPEIVTELPQDMIDSWKEHEVSWPGPSWETTYDDIKGPLPKLSILYFEAGVPKISGDYKNGYKDYSFYMGPVSDESGTMEVFKFKDLQPEDNYRISFYIDNIMG